MINMIVNVFDFNFFSLIGHNPPIANRKGMADALRTNYLLSVDEFSSKTRFQPMRFPISRRIPCSKLFVLRSIPLHGFRPADLSRESARHRNMSAGYSAQALSRRHSGPSVSKHLGRCERKTRLADLRRLRPGAHWNRQTLLCERRFRSAPGPDCLCVGFHHYRPLSFPFPMGLFSKTQRGNQTSYGNGSARFNPLRHPYHTRQSARRQILGPRSPRASRLLYHGSGS